MDRCVKIEHARLFGGLQLGRRQHRRDLGAPAAVSAGADSPWPTASFQPETLAIHAGQIPDAATGARALPIYQTTSFVFDSADHAASLFNLQTFGNVYSRLSNPTVAALEERVAALEGGRAGAGLGQRHGGRGDGAADAAAGRATTSSPPARCTAARSACWRSTSRSSASRRPSSTPTQPDAFAAAMRPNTRAVFAESLGNPSLAVLDIAAVAEVAHAHGVPLVDRQHGAVAVPVQPDRASAPTSSCTRRPSTSAATARRSAA